MRRILTWLAAVILLHSPALAQDTEEDARLQERGEDIVAAMGGEAEYESVFAEGFTQAVPRERFIGIKEQIEGQFGALIGVETVEPVSASGARIAIRFERGLANGSFTLEAQKPFLVTGFVLNDMQPVGDSAEQLMEDIAALPGEVGVLVTQLGANGAPLLEHNPDQIFAIGSTFKLYVLSALAHQIEAGDRRWDDVVPLGVRSYPSGQLQDWPQGSPITLQTLATLMISNSDNTATDQLMAVLGREAVEAEVRASGHSEPEAFFPFLTTRELFLLKSGEEAEIEQYRSADLAGRLEILQGLVGLDRPETEIQAAFTGGPVGIDVEWLASASDIARLFERLIALEDETVLSILGVNPSLSEAQHQAWDYVGYKGGSEPGVLNLSWLLRDPEGNWNVVTMSWNDSENVVEQSRLELLAMRAVALAATD